MNTEYAKEFAKELFEIDDINEEKLQRAVDRFCNSKKLDKSSLAHYKQVLLNIHPDKNLGNEELARVITQLWLNFKAKINNNQATTSSSESNATPKYEKRLYGTKLSKTEKESDFISCQNKFKQKYPNNKYLCNIESPFMQKIISYSRNNEGEPTYPKAPFAQHSTWDTIRNDYLPTFLVRLLLMESVFNEVFREFEEDEEIPHLTKLINDTAENQSIPNDKLLDLINNTILSLSDFTNSVNSRSVTQNSNHLKYYSVLRELAIFENCPNIESLAEFIQNWPEEQWPEIKFLFERMLNDLKKWTDAAERDPRSYSVSSIGIFDKGSNTLFLNEKDPFINSLFKPDSENSEPNFKERLHELEYSREILLNSTKSILSTCSILSHDSVSYKQQKYKLSLSQLLSNRLTLLNHEINNTRSKLKMYQEDPNCQPEIIIPSEPNLRYYSRYRNEFIYIEPIELKNCYIQHGESISPEILEIFKNLESKIKFDQIQKCTLEFNKFIDNNKASAQSKYILCHKLIDSIKKVKQPPHVANLASLLTTIENAMSKSTNEEIPFTDTSHLSLDKFIVEEDNTQQEVDSSSLHDTNTREISDTVSQQSNAENNDAVINPPAKTALTNWEIFCNFFLYLINIVIYFACFCRQEQYFDYYKVEEQPKPNFPKP